MPIGFCLPEHTNILAPNTEDRATSHDRKPIGSGTLYRQSQRAFSNLQADFDEQLTAIATHVLETRCQAVRWQR
jgi:hypothetical protein